MIKVKLRQAMQRHEDATGIRQTYARLAKVTGVSKHTLSSIGGHRHRNPGLKTIAKICIALWTTPAELLELEPAATCKIERAMKKHTARTRPKAKPTAQRKASRKKRNKKKES